MDLSGKVGIVTGGGGGIGSALARAVLDAGAKVLVADLDAGAAAAAISEVDPARAIAAGGDVSDETELARMIERAEKELGPVDIFFANAGTGTGVELGTEVEWELALDVNLIAHVRAARLLVPRWLERGGGYFVATASAAGLLTQIGSAPYAASKHAAVGFAEWLSVTYGERGVRVSCLCPMGVRTAMVEDGLASDDPAESLAARTVSAAGAILEPEEVARETLAAVGEERFLVLPHPEVLEFYRRKGADYDRWLGGMRRLQSQVDHAADQT
jgi:NAD(P)-dependent dehydrogenase (short-subunit alcohol dehydrogenase family)